MCRPQDGVEQLFEDAKMLTRGTVYWYGLNEHIERMVRNCEECQEAAKMPTKNTLNPWPTPEKVWKRSFKSDRKGFKRPDDALRPTR